MKENGPPPQPAIVIFWDNATQTFSYQADPQQVKNAEMVAAVLAMAHEAAKFTVGVVRSQQMQAKMMQDAQEQALQNQIFTELRKGKH